MDRQPTSGGKVPSHLNGRAKVTPISLLRYRMRSAGDLPDVRAIISQYPLCETDNGIWLARLHKTELHILVLIYFLHQLVKQSLVLRGMHIRKGLHLLASGRD